MNILDSLRTIFQEVNTARSLPEVLTIIVTEVHAAMGAEVCSVYLFDETDQHYVLMATKGLRQQSIGKVRLCRWLIVQVFRSTSRDVVSEPERRQLLLREITK